MTDIPIIFSAPMVKALLAGNKTMTRRLAWTTRRESWSKRSSTRPSSWQMVEAGDRLYVREAFNYSAIGTPYFKTDTDDTVHHSWRPSIHMPRKISRLTLVVTKTKVERLQSISEADAGAEGIELETITSSGRFYKNYSGGCPCAPWGSFRSLWESLHGEASWNENPDVVALTFTVYQINIDKMVP